MHPILGVIRNEVRIQSRRRGLKVMFISHALVMIAFLAMFGATNQASEIIAAGDALEAAWGDPTETVLFGTWAATSSLIAFLMPIVLADSIPYDKQVGVTEVLNSTPITYPQYLLGKAIGASLALTIALVAVLLIVAIPWWLVGFHYNIITFLAMTLLAVPALAFINTGLVVLAAAGQPSVFRGLLVGIAVLVVIPILIGLQHEGITPFLMPTRQPMLDLYDFNFAEFELLGTELTNAGAYIVNTIIGLLEIAVLFGFLVGWKHFKENRI